MMIIAKMHTKIVEMWWALKLSARFALLGCPSFGVHPAAVTSGTTQRASFAPAHHRPANEPQQ